MIKININNKRKIKTIELNYLAQAIDILNHNFDINIEFDRSVNIVGDLNDISLNAKHFYRTMIVKKLINNLKIVKEAKSG